MRTGVGLQVNAWGVYKKVTEKLVQTYVLSKHCHDL